MITDSRLFAFEVIHKIFNDGGFSNITLDNSFRRFNGDKAFVSALVYGVVERKITLDHFIFKYIDKKPKPKILTVLRMGVYQLIFMDKVPDAAAINESVELAKKIKCDFYCPLINAVLRKISNDKVIPDDLSVKYSVPKNLLNMWIKQYGKDCVESFLPAINEKPPVFAIPNKLFADSDELSYELFDEGIQCEVYFDTVKLLSGFDLKKSRAFSNGLFYIEDFSSYCCAKALEAKPGDVVFDMCSAPGGKAFTLAQCMDNQGKLYAFDIYESRVNLIREGAERLGFNCIMPSLNDAASFNSDLPLADRILCDVPCSGFGIIRRKPEIRYKELDEIKGLPDIQFNILKTSSSYLKTGGRLIYSTCTLNKKENQQVIEKFLKEFSNFSLIYDKTEFPDINSGDGFYYAVIEKNYD